MEKRNGGREGRSLKPALRRAPQSLTAVRALMREPLCGARGVKYILYYFPAALSSTATLL